MRLIDADATPSMGISNFSIMFRKVIDRMPTVDLWKYPSKGEIPDKDWSKHPLNVSKECFVVTKRGVGTIARWDNDYRTWFERPRLAVIDVIAWQYFIPPKKEYTY